jgi:outer membrane protein TolC
MYRPELAQARLDLANQDLEVVRTRNGLLPRLDAFASYGRSSLGSDWSGARDYLDQNDFENYRFGLQFEVPILNRGERARYTRAKLGREQAETAIANLQQMLDTQVHQAAVEVERQWQRIAATQEAVASRQEEMRVQQDRYSVGLSTNLDVLQVQRDLIFAQVNEVTARVSYIQALVGLYAAEGTLLERRGVTLDDLSKDK